MKKLGFGTMRLPLNDPKNVKDIDVAQTEKMFDLFLDSGFEYVDTAYPYHEGESERVVRKALVERYPRHAYKLATKLPTFNLKEPEDCERFFNEQLEKTGAGYFDYYLVHCLTTDLYEVAKKCRAFEFVSRMKEEGKVKEIGFSFHDTPEKLDEILTDHPEVDFVQLQINYLDWENPKVTARANYEVARKHNVPIVVMEPVKGGALENPPAEVKKLFSECRPGMSPASWAIRFAASLDGVMTVLSGMSNLAQMEDNLSYMRDFRPLDDTEQKIIQQAQRIMGKSAAIPCTGCRYCVEGCPRNIPIPEIFAAMNKRLANGQAADAESAYWQAVGGGSKASDCIGCGQCEKVCPQRLEVVKHLRGCAEVLEK